MVGAKTQKKYCGELKKKNRKKHNRNLFGNTLVLHWFLSFSRRHKNGKIGTQLTIVRELVGARQ